jgi:hypothetical protein
MFMAGLRNRIEFDANIVPFSMRIEAFGHQPIRQPLPRPALAPTRVACSHASERPAPVMATAGG